MTESLLLWSCRRLGLHPLFPKAFGKIHCFCFLISFSNRKTVERDIIKGDKVRIVKRNCEIHDFVWPGEKVELGELVIEEHLEDVLEELKEF